MGEIEDYSSEDMVREHMEHEFEEGYGVLLDLDPETRIWEMRARGTAAMLMFLLVDASSGSVMTKLLEEAKFDQVVRSMDGI